LYIYLIISYLKNGWVIQIFCCYDTIRHTAIEIRWYISMYFFLVCLVLSRFWVTIDEVFVLSVFSICCYFNWCVLNELIEINTPSKFFPKALF
jgi:hypothetical protein